MFSFLTPKPDPGALAALTELLTPLLTATKRIGKPLKTLVRDPFVAGFIGGNCHVVGTEHGLEGRPVGRVIMAVSERFGTDLLKGTNSVSEKDPDFVRGVQTGRMIARYARGIEDYAGHRAMEGAIESANMPYAAAHLAKTGEAAAVRQATRQEIASTLVEQVFLEVVEQRFR